MTRLLDVLEEGAADAGNRRAAAELQKFIAQRWVINPAADGIKTVKVGHATGPMVTYNCNKFVKSAPEEMRPQLARLMINFISHPSEDDTGSYGRGGGWGLVNIFVLAPEGLEDPVDFGEWVESSIQQLTAQYRSTMFHELVHHLDYARTEDKRAFVKAQTPGAKYGDPEDTRKYHEDPYEMNAQFQEQFANFEHWLEKRNVRTFDQVKQVARASTAQEFARNLYAAVDPGIRSNWNPDMRRRFSKRAAQFWDDLKNRFPQGTR